MGTGKELPMKVSLEERLIETTRIVADEALMQRNRMAGETLLQNMQSDGLTFEPRSRGHLVRAVPVDRIDAFLRAYRTDPSNVPADLLTDPRLIRDYIAARADSELRLWDVFIASSTGRDLDPAGFGHLTLVPYARSVDPADFAKGVLTISGTSRRVGSAEDESEGLTEDEIARALETYRQTRPDKVLPKTISPAVWRKVPGRRPLMILRLVRPKVEGADGQTTWGRDVLAWGLSFPSSRIGGGTVDYVVNTIRMREMFGEAEIEEAPGDTE
jgi:hypothetical protein